MKSRHRALCCVTLIAIAAFGAAPTQADDPPPAERQGAPESRRDGTGWTFRFDLTTRYDDNITELSDTDRTRLESPSCPTVQSCRSRFRIESADDVVVVPEGRLEWSRISPGGFESSIRGEARANRYSRNSIKDYEVYSLRFGQDLSAGRHGSTLIVRLEHIPDFYLRELTVPEASRLAGSTVRGSAAFAATEASLAVRQVVVPGYLDVEGTVARESRDYAAPFDERDGDLAGWRAAAFVHPSGRRGLAFYAGYQSQRYDARGERASTEAVEPDISNERVAWLAGASVVWGSRLRRGSLAVDLFRERRDFTSSDPRDAYHFGRDDTRTRLALGARQALGPHLFLEGRASFEENDSDLGPAVVSSGDDVTDFTQNVYSLGAGWRF